VLPPPSSPRNGYPTAFCDRVPSLQLELCCWDSIPDIDQQPPPPSSVPPIPPADELVPINAQVCIHNVSSAKTLRDQDYVWPSIGPFLIKYCMHYSTLICRLFFVQLFCLAGDQLDHRHCVVLHLFLFLSRPSWHHELVRADVEDEEGGTLVLAVPGLVMLFTLFPGGPLPSCGLLDMSLGLLLPHLPTVVHSLPSPPW
jgi:hypothetical protein